LPRKRIGYDLEKNKCEIVFYSIGKDFIDMVVPKVKDIFGIEKAKIRSDGVLK
jgi:hypothetical protein